MYSQINNLMEKKIGMSNDKKMMIFFVILFFSLIFVVNMIARNAVNNKIYNESETEKIEQKNLVE